MKLTYLGQEGYLLKCGDQALVIDPYLSYYVDENCCSEQVNWVRRYAPPVTAEDLQDVDFVLCTHSHYDHMDPATLSAIARCNPKAVFVCPKPVKAQMVSYGIEENRVIGAIDGEILQLGVFSVEPIPAAHEELHTDENGAFMELGYRIGCGGLRIYHAGDCCLYEGLTQRLAGTDVLMLPVNGRSWYKRYVCDIIGNMTCEEAVLLAKNAGAKLLIPMHYDLYDVNCLNPAQFVDTLWSLNPTQQFHMFVPGETYILGE